MASESPGSSEPSPSRRGDTLTGRDMPPLLPLPASAPYGLALGCRSPKQILALCALDSAAGLSSPRPRTSPVGLCLAPRPPTFLPGPAYLLATLIAASVTSHLFFLSFALLLSMQPSLRQRPRYCSQVPHDALPQVLLRQRRQDRLQQVPINWGVMASKQHTNSRDGLRADPEDGSKGHSVATVGKARMKVG